MDNSSTNYSCDVFTMWYEYRHELYNSFILTEILSGTIAIPTMMLNVVVLLTVWKTPSLHTPSNIFLCNLAISDFFLASLGIPLSVVWLSSYHFFTSQLASCSLAYASSVIGSFLGVASYVTLTAATVDRYLALKLHLRYRSYVTPQRVVSVCAGIWLFSLVASLAIFINISAYCWTISSSVLICSAIMGSCYHKIFQILRRHRLQIKGSSNTSVEGDTSNASTSQNQKVSNLLKFKKSIFAVMYVFGLCILLYTPYMSCTVAFEFFGASLLLLKFWIISTILVYTNSALNRLIYCWRIGDMRIAIKEQLNKIVSCVHW